MNTKTKKIDPQAWYTMQDIVKGRMFPWARHVSTVRNITIQDRKKKNILKASITGKKTGTKYLFRGENILKFINEFEAGKV